jgi:hypothetical protein
MMHFITGAKFPESCVCLGGTFTWKDEHQFTAPDCVQATWIYPEGFLVSISNNLGKGSGSTRKFYGDKGVLKLDNWNAPTYSAEGAPRRDGAIRGENAGPAGRASRPFPRLAAMHAHREDAVRADRRRFSEHGRLPYGHPIVRDGPQNHLRSQGARDPTGMTRRPPARDIAVQPAVGHATNFRNEFMNTSDNVLPPRSSAIVDLVSLHRGNPNR